MMTKGFYSLPPMEQGKRMQALAEKALKHWDLEGADLTLVKIRENAVFHVKGPEGDSYALRVHRYNYHSDESLYSEHLWTTALSGFGMDLPPVVPTPAGDLFCHEQHQGVPEPRQVDLSLWVNGRPLSEILAEKPDPDTVTEAVKIIGHLAARIHNQATGWRLPRGFIRHAWDAEGLAGDQPFWGRFWELPDLTRSQRALMLKARNKIFADLLVYGRQNDTYSMIHADLLPENILIEGQKIRIIDFDDAGFGWHQFELATVLMSYHGTDYHDQVKEALIAGYRDERDLSDEALSLLPLFCLARALTWVGWSLTRYETETAQLIRPFVIEMACSLAEDYLSQ